MIGIGANLAYQPTATCYRSGAALEYLFADEAAINPREGSAQLMCTRTGATATRFNSAGQLEIVAANIARLDHDRATLRFENRLLSSQQFDNATHWPKSGATATANAKYSHALGMNGFKLVESAANAPHYMYQSQIGSSETVTLSVDAMAGERSQLYLSMSNFVSWSCGAVFNLTTGVVISTDAPNADYASPVASIESLGGGVYRCKFTVTKGAVNTTNNPQIQIANAGAFAYLGDGTSGIYIFRAQLNSGTTALEYQRTGASAFAKWYACKGLLIEEARTSAVRNNTMAGTVAGTPGTAPTYWSLTGSTSGITCSIVGFGGDEGIDYIDVSYVGTASAAVNFFIQTDSAIGQGASSGQTWTSSVYVKKVSGNNPSTLLLAPSGRAATTGAPLENSTLNIAPTSAALATQRFEKTITLANAGTAHIVQYLHVGATNGEVVNVTLRIGLPQLEQGSFATSAIKTSGAAVTRNADAITIDSVASWLNASEGTFFVDGTYAQVVSGNSTLFRVDDGTDNNRMMIRVVTGNAAFQSVTSGSNDATLSTGAATAGASLKQAGAYKLNDFASSRNGAAVVTDSAVSVPSVTTTRLGGDSSSVNYINAHIKRFAYWRTRRANADLVQLTA